MVRFPAPILFRRWRDCNVTFNPSTPSREDRSNPRMRPCYRTRPETAAFPFVSWLEERGVSTVEGLQLFQALRATVPTCRYTRHGGKGGCVRIGPARGGRLSRALAGLLVCNPAVCPRGTAQYRTLLLRLLVLASERATSLSFGGTCSSSQASQEPLCRAALPCRYCKEQHN